MYNATRILWATNQLEYNSLIWNKDNQVLLSFLTLPKVVLILTRQERTTNHKAGQRRKYNSADYSSRTCIIVRHWKNS